MTRGRLGGYLESALHRTGTATLNETLARDHGLECASLRELDVGVHDVRCRDGRRLIVRVFPSGRPRGAVESDAALLRELRTQGYPTESPATDHPVGSHAGQPLLITDVVARGRRPSPQRLGDLLGRLHALAMPGAEPGPGGAWHHLVPGGGPPAAELGAIRELLTAAGTGVRPDGADDLARLSSALDAADDCAGLPEALIHPDFVAANARGPEPVIIDWTGCGRGPRLWSLAWLLWSAGIGDAAAVMKGYAAHVALTDTERARLAGAVIARPAVLAAWSFVTARASLAEAAARTRTLIPTAGRIAETAAATATARGA